jgi:hypothetical protein
MTTTNTTDALLAAAQTAVAAGERTIDVQLLDGTDCRASAPMIASGAEQVLVLGRGMVAASALRLPAQRREDVRSDAFNAMLAWDLKV